MRFLLPLSCTSLVQAIGIHDEWYDMSFLKFRQSSVTMCPIKLNAFATWQACRASSTDKENSNATFAFFPKPWLQGISLCCQPGGYKDEKRRNSPEQWYKQYNCSMSNEIAFRRQKRTARQRGHTADCFQTLLKKKMNASFGMCTPCPAPPCTPLTALQDSCTTVNHNICRPLGGTMMAHGRAYSAT